MQATASMHRDTTVAPTMTTDDHGCSKDARRHEQILAAVAQHRQSLALNSCHHGLQPSDVYRDTADDHPVLGSPSVNAMLQGSRFQSGFPLALAANQVANALTVADPPVLQTPKQLKVREVELGAGITLGYLSLADYKFITSLVVIEEEY